MKNLLIRTLTGAAYVIVVVCCTVLSPWSLGALIVLLTLLAVNEFLSIHCADGRRRVNRAVVLCGSVLLSLAVFVQMYVAATDIFLLLVPYTVFLLMLFIFELFADNEDPVGNLALAALSQAYVVWPLALLSVLAFGKFPVVASERPFYLFPLAVLVFVWSNDTFAYLTGSLLGRHKLFPRVSPGKTWEGSVGGAVLTVGVSVLLWHFWPVLSLPQWMGLSLVVVVFGTFGDLTESLMKRKLGLKDSGHLLPGHGGILDRIDSLLLAIPAAVAYLYICGL
ncbi:MAG: phosphatidate cytidylyltransferase [Bacteroidaceae bacterium]|nr:phosphatidate cytidylyltransferase [Bacteroidaceae bacterium]